MKKYVLILLSLCMLLSGCSNVQKDPAETHASTPEGETIEASAPPSASDAGSGDQGADASTSPVTVYPLPDPTMDALENATLAISLAEGGAYTDDTGAMQMDVTVYTYDRFDMVDIAGLKAGDVMVTHSGDVAVSSVERNELGTVWINGGLEEGGFDLFSNDDGVYYESGFNDSKNWYELGTVTLRVSADFEFRDHMDPDKGEQIYYAGSFLAGEVTDYHFTPHNTTIRTENGQIVSMERIYMP